MASELSKSTNTLARHGILTREQLAAELSLKDASLREWEKRGLPKIVEGKKVLYHVPTVVKWLLRNRPKSV